LIEIDAGSVEIRLVALLWINVVFKSDFPLHIP
jgi:hypothetical protein